MQDNNLSDIYIGGKKFRTCINCGIVYCADKPVCTMCEPIETTNYSTGGTGYSEAGGLTEKEEDALLNHVRGMEKRFQIFNAILVTDRDDPKIKPVLQVGRAFCNYEEAISECKMLQSENGLMSAIIWDNENDCFVGSASYFRGSM